MQEEQTVSFQPMGYEGPNRWFVNLFVIYLLCVLLMTVVRTVRLLWILRKRRKAQECEALLESSSQSFFETCYFRIRSIRNFSHLTFLLAVLVLAWDATDILAGVATAKVASLPYVAARLANALVPFGMGVIICSAQFSCAMFLENRTGLGRLKLERTANKSKLPGERPPVTTS